MTKYRWSFVQHSGKPIVSGFVEIGITDPRTPKSKDSARNIVKEALLKALISDFASVTLKDCISAKYVLSPESIIQNANSKMRGSGVEITELTFSQTASGVATRLLESLKKIVARGYPIVFENTQNTSDNQHVRLRLEKIQDLSFEVSRECMDRIPEFVNRWINIQLNTQPVDRKRVEASIGALYAHAGFEKPEVVFLSCPLSCSLAGIGFREEKVNSFLEHSVLLEKFLEKLDGDLQCRDVYKSIQNEVKTVLSDLMTRQDKLIGPTNIKAEKELRNSIRKVRDTPITNIDNSITVEHFNWLDFLLRPIEVMTSRLTLDDFEWHMSRHFTRTDLRNVGSLSMFEATVGTSPRDCALMEFLNDVCNQTVDYPLFELAKDCSQFWSFKKVCFVSERPSKVEVQDRRLHCESGPAISYANGLELYYWHNVLVPRDIVMSSETITVESIIGEKNVEVRRIMIERFGMERFMQEANARVVSEDRYGVLYHIAGDRQNDNIDLVVKVKNSTPEPDGTFKEYFLQVPPRMETAHEAVAWTFGFANYPDYNPDKET